MSRNHAFGAPVTEEQVSFAFQLLTGMSVSENIAQVAMNTANIPENARLELFKAIAGTAQFAEFGQDYAPILFDQAVRKRVFSGTIPPKANLFCVGAPRSGTTTLSALLARNPSVYISPVKETNFFSHLSKRVSPNGVSDELYAFYFSGWSGEPILADFTPVNLRYPRAMAGIHAYNPDAKIMACLRDPVDRALSAFFYTRSLHGVSDPESFFCPVLDGFCREDPNEEPWFSPQALLRQSCYSHDLAKTARAFGDLLIVDFGEFSDLAALNRRVCAFIGIEAADIGRSVVGEVPVNSSHREQSPAVERARAKLTDFFAVELETLARDWGLDFRR